MLSAILEGMRGLFFWGWCLLLGFAATGCGLFDRDDGEPLPRGQWVKYEPVDASCGNGDPYAFYVQFSESGSEDLVIFLQAGGVCWDYASCVPGAEPSARQPVNLDGLPDDYANMHEEIDVDGTSIRPNVKVIYALLNDDPDISPMADWNKVFLPYCTGDAYLGASVVNYQDPTGVMPDREFRHVGHLNVLAAVDMLNRMFGRVNRLFVGGGSAGGLGALVNYYFIRTGLNVEGSSYLLNDSGPIFPALEPTSRTTRLYEVLRQTWKLDQVIDSGLPSPEAIKADFGALNVALADAFPDDRFASALYRLDYNYTLYSYERFYDFENGTIGELDFLNTPPPGLDQNVAADRTAFYSLWWDDVQLLRDQYAGRANLGYFIPYWRQTNDAHLTTITGAEESNPLDLAPNLAQWILGLDPELRLNPELVWVGTEIDVGGDVLDIRDYVDILLDDQAALPSHFADDDQAVGPFVDCTPGEGSAPLMPVAVDSARCEAAVN